MKKKKKDISPAFYLQKQL